MDLLDQEGYIFRMDVNGAIRWEDRIIRGRDTSIIVNDDYWSRVVWFEARAESESVAVLGSDETHEISKGALGLLELLAYETNSDPERTLQGMLARVARVHMPVTIVARIEHPDTGAELRRWTFHSVRWDGDPVVREIPSKGPMSKRRHNIVVPFRAEWFEVSGAPERQSLL